ncbi:unnamed protein product [Didymodactylos carnosus]|uniref:Uncharacterized protein n=1 Tax=Didymodactylos carnosus TaxID=1234261 RepID=A0A813XUZ8_9BILA|nr:unnamed protein product [Didymodactylos carnosus]CAF0873440.1 unnamed protein product [Didymodactylos carnosus]CAF3534365.1 unnamed protein product [Didymodactylos carnosus]CAF3660625.1 unnamed protein product [Didymodactylos carnosus]
MASEQQISLTSTSNLRKNNNRNSINDNSSTHINSNGFSRGGWHKAIAAIDEMRRRTEHTKNQHDQQYALDTPPPSSLSEESSPSQQLAKNAQVKVFQDELLFAKTGNLNLDKLSDDFAEMKRTFQEMSANKQETIQSVTLTTNITKTALLIIFRSIESIALIVTKGNRKMTNFQTVIATLRSKQDLPLPGKLLCEWYQAANILELLLNDPDWLCKRRKAKWSIEVCTETLIWSKGVLNENFIMDHPRPIFDRHESLDIVTTRE